MGFESPSRPCSTAVGVPSPCRLNQNKCSSVGPGSEVESGLQSDQDLSTAPRKSGNTAELLSVLFLRLDFPAIFGLSKVFPVLRGDVLRQMADGWQPILAHREAV
jgi:hypothetical protein